MSATKNRGVSGLNELEILVAAKATQAASLILAGNRSDDQASIKTLNDSLQWFLDRGPVTAQGEVLKPKTFAEILALPKSTQGQFNQLASEIDWWDILDQIEDTCFLQPERIERARPFLNELWKGEIAQSPYQPPKNWRYMPVATAIETYRNIFGSSLKADAVMSAVRSASSRSASEGIAVWPKLSTLAKLFGVEGNPLEATEEGRAAYARIVELFIPKVGKAYLKAHGKQFAFANWREGNLTGSHIILTPAGRATWQFFESQTGDDFCFSPVGGMSGASYAGFSQRLARLRIGMSSDQLPQDCIMTGATLASQPDRLCKGKHLRIDCPGIAYSPDAGGGFWDCVRWGFDAGGRQLEFDSGYAAMRFRALARPSSSARCVCLFTSQLWSSRRPGGRFPGFVLGL